MSQVKYKKTNTNVYKRWTSMLSRCRNPNDPNYKNYGGRDIAVCESWHEFDNFYKDMGDLPFPRAQLDRIDNEKGYSPENCRWTTAKLNSRNRRTTKKITTHLGEIVQQELLEKIGWTKDQYRWFVKKYGINWVLENYKNGSLPLRTNESIDRDDLVNKEFGKWFVLKFNSYTKKTGHLYLCRCQCGIQKEIPRHNLLSGKTNMCRSCAAINFHKKRKQIYRTNLKVDE